jgi:hypothetical protein
MGVMIDFRSFEVACGHSSHCNCDDDRRDHRAGEEQKHGGVVRFSCQHWMDCGQVRKEVWWFCLLGLILKAGSGTCSGSI